MNKRILCLLFFVAGLFLTASVPQEVRAQSAPTPTPITLPKVISGGVLNGRALSLPSPVYPVKAKRYKVRGKVSVKIWINRKGEVYKSEALSGHTLLRPAALAAALKCRFEPTLYSGKPVEVIGIITYSF